MIITEKIKERYLNNVFTMYQIFIVNEVKIGRKNWEFLTSRYENSPVRKMDIMHFEKLNKKDDSLELIKSRLELILNEINEDISDAALQYITYIKGSKTKNQYLEVLIDYYNYLLKARNILKDIIDFADKIIGAEKVEEELRND